jgi:zinc transport system substrate-binding protein
MNKAKRKITIIILVIISSGIIIFIASDLWSSAVQIKTKAEQRKAQEKINVAVSFYPIYFFAQQIAGNKADILDITPSKSDPQSYKLTTEDVKNIEKSNLVILNGLGFESWSNDAVEINKSICVASANLTENQVIQITEAKINPYIWLSPILAKQMADKIFEGFLTKDLNNKNYYQANAERLKSELNNLDVEYKNKLANCQDKNFVVFSPAFNYLAKDYKLNQIILSGLSINADLTDQQIKNIKDFIKEQNVKYIFVEDSPNSQWQKDIEEKLGVRLLLLDVISKDFPKENYFSRMEKNLENLKIGLQCQ